MKYLWTEDTGAGLHFWKLINQVFFDNELAIESKGSNQGILDALSDLEIKKGDEYYIAFDYVVDNQDIRNKYRLLKSIAEKSEGKVVILDMICFELFLAAYFVEEMLPQIELQAEHIHSLWVEALPGSMAMVLENLHLLIC